MLGCSVYEQIESNTPRSTLNSRSGTGNLSDGIDKLNIIYHIGIMQGELYNVKAYLLLAT
jgi:hypothetical protein